MFFHHRPNLFSIHSLLLAMALCCLSVSIGASPVEKNPLEDTSVPASDGRGEALFNTYCIACHNGAMPEAPRVEAFKQYSPERIVDSLNKGVMSTQGLMLSNEETRLVAEYLSAKPLSAVVRESPQFLCSDDKSMIDTGKQDANWTSWGGPNGNRRYQAAERKLNSDNVGSLELKWAFGFPDTTRSRSQPTVHQGRVYIGGQNGIIFALDSQTGCTHWTYDAGTEVRGALLVQASVQGDLIVFGDFKANVHALRAENGDLVWQSKVHDHPLATITGSPTAGDGRVFIPVSSSEVVPAGQSGYPCCTFRGAVVALDLLSGELIWRYFTTDPPVSTGQSSVGTEQFGPSGAPVWSSPTFDKSRGLVYITTGQNYSSPATGTSDAVIAIDANNGESQWVSQVWENDAWNGGCVTRTANCPAENGPDFDIGASAVLMRVDDDRDLLMVGQKSGLVFAMNPDNKGEIVWQKRVGRGGTMGGVHWGMSANDAHLLVGVSDLKTNNPYAEGEAQPGLHALNPSDGSFIWRTKLDNQCPPDIKFLCFQGLSAAITSSPGLVFAGGLDGILRAFDSSNGQPLWSFATAREFDTVNRVKAQGGAIEAAGPVIVDGQIFVSSGYDKWGEMPGNVLLVFGLPE